jgi:alpha-1,2-mannosyltransferase
MRLPMMLRTTLGRWSAWTVLFVAGALAIAVALSVTQGLQQRVGHDFHVFWQAGRNFASGDPLYHGYLPGARVFKYPPFAAMVFQVVAPFSLQVAGAICSFLNLVLWGAAVYLTREIVARTFPSRRHSPVPLVLAVVFTAQFFLDNFHHVQMNEIIFVLVMLGIHAYLRGKDVGAAAWLVAATAIKITPIFFVAWLVIRGRRRAALAVPPLVLACVVVPLLVRGPARGSAELVEYYHTFLEGHQHGGIRDYTAGQNLAGLVNRMTQPSASDRGATYGYLPASDQTAQLAYKVLWATVFLIMITKLVLLRRRGAPVSALELAMIFLAALLLSPITFLGHLVSLLFVYHAFLSIRLVSPAPPVRVAAALLVVAMAVTGLSGRDLAGRTVYLAIGGYSVYAWTMLLLFLAAVVLAGREHLWPQASDRPFAPAC